MLDLNFGGLTQKERRILELLHEHGEQYGLQLVAKSNGDLHRGSIYVYTSRLEDKGLVVARDEARSSEIGIPRRLFQLNYQMLDQYRANNPPKPSWLKRVARRSKWMRSLLWAFSESQWARKVLGGSWELREAASSRGEIATWLRVDDWTPEHRASMEMCPKLDEEVWL